MRLHCFGAFVFLKERWNIYFNGKFKHNFVTDDLNHRVSFGMVRIKQILLQINKFIL